MKLNWNFLGGGGAKQKAFCGESMDIFWNYTFLTCTPYICLGLQNNKLMVQGYTSVSMLFIYLFI